MPSELNAPGLKRRKRKAGPDALYWCARADLVKAGYRPETVRLAYSLDDPRERDLISAACMKFQAEMLEWSSGRGRERAPSPKQKMQARISIISGRLRRMLSSRRRCATRVVPLENREPSPA